MQLRVVTWNAEGMFAPYDATKAKAFAHQTAQTRRAGPHDALKVLRKLDADIVVIPEFGSKGWLDETTQLAIQSLGYEIIEVVYADRYEPPIEMALLSRLPITHTRVLRLGEMRSIGEIIVTTGTHDLRVIAVHLDDKTEENRLMQIKDLTDEVNSNLTVPTIVLGDFNAMHENSRFARVSRSRAAHKLSGLIRHDQLKRIASRLHEMALGTTIHYLLTHTQLLDLDPRRQRTISGKQSGLEWVPAVRLAKIDWVFGTHHIAVKRYRVSRDVGSDHRPIIVDVQVRS